MRNDLTTTGLERQRGAALATSLILLVPISLVAVSSMQSRNIEERMASNYQQHIQANSLAESGLREAMDMLGMPCGVENGFDGELQNNGGVLLSGVSLGDGTYSVSTLDNFESVESPQDQLSDTDGMILLNSVGTIGSLSVTLQQFVQIGGTNTAFAVLTNGDLGVDGSPSLNGCMVNVHANGDVDILGGGQMAGMVSATGSVFNNGASVDGGTTSSADSVTVPEVNPTTLSGEATYKLNADGTVDNSDGTQIWDGTGTDWNGWQFTAGDWTLTTDTAPVGVYYVDGTAVIDGSPGSGATPWAATIVAEQNIIVNGDVQMESFDASLEAGDLRNLALISGGDLQVNGSSNQSFSGTLAAAEQIELTGDPSIDGKIIARDDATDNELVVSNLISGDMIITNGLADPLAESVPVQSVAWRSVGN